MKTLLRQFKLIQIKYQRPDIWTKMADSTESEIDAIEDTVYLMMWKNNELSMLLRVNQTGGRVLPAGSFTERGGHSVSPEDYWGSPHLPYSIGAERGPVGF